jgi:hypothetical protein
MGVLAMTDTVNLIFFDTRVTLFVGRVDLIRYVTNDLRVWPGDLLQRPCVSQVDMHWAGCEGDLWGSWL